MATLFTYIDNYLNEKSDPRTADWPFVSSVAPVFIVIVSYLYFVIKCGPDYMRDRKPYDLKIIISAYNISQICGCAYIIKELLASGWYNDYSLGCQPVDTSRSPKALRMATTTWWVMLLKMTELIETVFFVLRKKQNQVTGLHLYHHTSTLLISWQCVKFIPGGMVTFPVLLNCLVHVLMYSYYLISLHASKQQQQKLNKFKRYLTLIQMIQFCLILLHIFQGLAPSCDTSKFIICTFIPNVFLVFYLFYDFYKKAYAKSNKAR